MDFSKYSFLYIFMPIIIFEPEVKRYLKKETRRAINKNRARRPMADGEAAAGNEGHGCGKDSVRGTCIPRMMANLND